MQAVGDLPASDNEDEDEEEEEEGDDDLDEKEPEEESQAGPSKSAEPLDEAAFQAQMATRMESLRLNKALGNDDPDDSLDQISDESSESESESDSEGSDTQSIAAQTDYTTYQRPPKVHKPRPTAKKMGQKDIVAQTVEAEMKARASGGRASGGSGSNKAGKAKGHKWKSNANYLVGKDSGW